MTYEYTLNKQDSIKYGFTHLLCNGWFGIHSDQFNKKFDDNKKCYVKVELTENDIDRITKNALNLKEY